MRPLVGRALRDRAPRSFGPRSRQIRVRFVQPDLDPRPTQSAFRQKARQGVTAIGRVRMQLQRLACVQKDRKVPADLMRLHPEDRIKTPYSSWTFDSATTRMPEFTAPGLGRQSTLVTIQADLKENATGVLYALGGGSGGLT